MSKASIENEKVEVRSRRPEKGKIEVRRRHRFEALHDPFDKHLQVFGSRDITAARVHEIRE